MEEQGKTGENREKPGEIGGKSEGKIVPNISFKFQDALGQNV